jgi:hypothetical protein
MRWKPVVVQSEMPDGSLVVAGNCAASDAVVADRLLRARSAADPLGWT